MTSRRTYLTGIGATFATVAVSGCMDMLDQPPDPPENEEALEADLDGFHADEGGECTSRDEGEITITQNPNFGNSLMFEGVLLTPDPHHQARIAEESYDEESGTYTLRIEASSTSGDDEATQDCVGEVTYSGGVLFEGELPLKLRIEHDTVADDAVEEFEFY